MRLFKLELHYHPKSNVVSGTGTRKVYVLPKREFTSLIKLMPNYITEPCLGTTIDTTEGTVVAILPSGSSTRTRLHELAHIEKGHISTTDPLLYIEQELQADAYACTKMQSGLKGNHVLRAARSTGFHFTKYSPSQIADITVEALKDLSSSLEPEYLEHIREKVNKAVTEDRKKR